MFSTLTPPDNYLNIVDYKNNTFAIGDIIVLTDIVDIDYTSTYIPMGVITTIIKNPVTIQNEDIGTIDVDLPPIIFYNPILNGEQQSKEFYQSAHNCQPAKEFLLQRIKNFQRILEVSKEQLASLENFVSHKEFISQIKSV